MKAGDVVWHLGDFFFLNCNDRAVEKAVEVLNRLNGNIHCILGNHDNPVFFDKIMERTNKIVNYHRLKEIKIGSGKERKKLVMCHYPLISWNLSHRGSLQIFGHHHGSIHHPGKAVDVGLDGSLERLGEHRFWTENDIIDYLYKKPIWKFEGDHHG